MAAASPSARRAESERRLQSRPESRELRIGYSDRGSLLAAWLDARGEDWMAECHVDLERCELVVRTGEPARRPILCLIDGGRASHPAA